MKLSDRLTRAGIVFIMLGTTAALIPQKSGDALATESMGCPSGVVFHLGNSTNYTLTTEAVGTGVTVTAAESSSSDTIAVAYAPMSDFNGSVSGNGTTFTVSPASTGTTTGSVVFTATFTNQSTHTVDYTEQFTVIGS